MEKKCFVYTCCIYIDNLFLILNISGVYFTLGITLFQFLAKIFEISVYFEFNNLETHYNMHR